MNERIEKFARECGAWNQVYGNRNFMIDEHFDIEKFAELIVRESVGVADDYVKDCICEEHKDCKHPRSAIGRKIREHFGVEE